VPTESNTIALCEEVKEFLKVKSESTAKIEVFIMDIFGDLIGFI
jgi:hypothetical protein